jgi:hypothetical protein
MPHEKIWCALNSSATAEFPQPDQNSAEVRWSPGPTGYIQLTVQRPGLDARSAADDAAAEQFAYTAFTEEAGLDAETAERLAKRLGKYFVYSAGEPLWQTAIQLDRHGCNELIRKVRRGRRAVYGDDE